jgi:hypothetical protein
VKTPVVAAALVGVLIGVLTVLMVIWIAPAVGVHDSSCEQYPLYAGCRLPAAQITRVPPRGKDDNAQP